jgi:hypothetical protein
MLAGDDCHRLQPESISGSGSKVQLLFDHAVMGYKAEVTVLTGISKLKKRLPPLPRKAVNMNQLHERHCTSFMAKGNIM